MSNLTNCSYALFDSIANDTEVNDLILVQEAVAIIVPIIFGIIVIIGFVGNSLVILVVSAEPQMRSTTNLLIINLAVADWLFVIFCIPFTATDYSLPEWPFGNVWCKCVQYLIIVTACASVYTLVLMSFDRYLAVVHPVASMSVRTGRYAIIAITIVWLATLTCSVPVIMMHGEFDENEYRLRAMSNSSCPIARTNETSVSCRFLPEYNWPLFQVTFFLFSYVVPLFLICGLYVPMLLRLWKSSATVSAKSQRGRKRVTRLVLVVVGVFAFCWCPIQVILVLKSLDMYPLTFASIVAQIVSHVLAYMNSCINPILYAFLSDNFRKAFRKVIYCRSRLELNHHGRLGPMTKTTRANSTGDIL